MCAREWYIAAEIDSADWIDFAVMVTSSDEASAVGGKIVPFLGEVDRVKADPRTGQGELGLQ